MRENIYLKQIEINLPRLLSLYDQSPWSKTYGLGDRQFWGWKLIDFPNATFQGAAHGLARLLASGLLPSSFDKDATIELIFSMVNATKEITRSNGSLEEAFPYESSFCVTALVAYDLLKTSELLKDICDSDFHGRIREVVKPLINFLTKNDETHAIISNHLATAVAALYLWEDLANERTGKRATEILEIIFNNQSSEGWLSEYGGADPGYQSLATYYLAEVYRLRPSLRLKELLANSLAFIKYCVHPDGSFGGIYGSRNTRFYYPAGFEFLSREFTDAAWVAQKMRESIHSNHTATLNCMDASNLVPMFNAYAWAAEEFFHQDVKIVEHFDNFGDKYFEKAGLYLKSTPDFYFWLSVRKAGAWGKYDKKQNKWLGDFGALWRSTDGYLYTGQEQQAKVEFEANTIRMHIPLVRHNQMLPSPIKFLLLRILNLTLMRLPVFSKIIKKMLVRMLIQKKQKIAFYGKRYFDLNCSFPLVEDIAEDGWKSQASIKPFYAIHMASQGYWQE